MKRNIYSYILVLAAVLGLAHTAAAQTLNVNVGNVTYAYSAAQVGDVTCAGANQLTILGRTYSVADITDMVVTAGSVADNTVRVDYGSTGAHVTVAGNIASHLTVTATAADVSVVADASLANEVTYTLSGTSADGSFYMDGEMKSTVVLDNLHLTSRSGGAVTIDNGKRIAVRLVGDNVLADAAGGSQKACMFVNGHVEMTGQGSLTITGNASHGYFSDEYTVLKADCGSLTVAAAKNDGLHVNEYFRMDGGTVSVTCEGDGLDVGKKLKGSEYDGQVIINGGSLTLSSTGDAGKGIKAEGDITIAGGTTAVTVSGKAYYDTEKQDVTSSSAMKTDGNFNMTSGNLSLMATGMGSKGLNVTGNISVGGGSLTVVTTGSVYKYDSANDSKPNAVKADGSITLSGGDVRVAASPSKGTAFKSDADFVINGGTVMGIGGKASVPDSSSAKAFNTFTGQSVKGGTTFTLGGVSFDIPAAYSNPSAYVVVAK